MPPRCATRSASCSIASSPRGQGVRISLPPGSRRPRFPRPSAARIPGNRQSTQPGFGCRPARAGRWRPAERMFKDHRRQVSHFVFWTLAEYCGDFKLPFDLMIGVNRASTAAASTRDRTCSTAHSLIQYGAVQRIPEVTFPISVLTSQNQELVSYAWIFPNVVTNGHWWYSNMPAFIEPDAAPGWKPCRKQSRLPTTATPTSWNSCCQSSRCTSGFWRRFWPNGLSATAAGARHRPWSWAAACFAATSNAFSTWHDGFKLCRNSMPTAASRHGRSGRRYR